ncbi:nitrilase-related carbon-nitrogen hydrolase [Pantoea sp. B65]|uniref:nitrilase-related carbon-nitrogen hydrolase n=1 Tax=Pantoea sp. B65 TaxID=2813359 RepID=UPI0039B45E98
MTETHLQVAAIQFEPTQFRKEENISQLLTLAAQAAQGGARLIVMPEMGTTGYCWRDREEVAPWVETVAGETCRRFSALAREHDCYLVLGMPEEDAATGLYYNSAVLIGPAGVIGVHRKTHPYISEPKWAANGDLGHQVFATPIGNIALLICMDIHFIETARLAAVGGAQIICHISNWLAERTPAPYWLTRAWENGCALIESNRWGWERGVQFSGGSCVVDGDGRLLAARDSGDGIVAAEIQLPQHNPTLAKRRPELYQRLMTNTFSWNPGDFFGLYGMNPLPQGKRSDVAVAQFTPRGQPEANLQKMREMAQAAKAAGAELLVFPEKALTGGGGREQAISASHPAVIAFLQLAMALDMTLLSGWIEQEGDRFYNSALLVGPQGVIANYRQIHLNLADRQWATAGERWISADLPCGRVGLLLGEDLLIPEAGRILALEGCDLIACPAALAEPLPLAHSGTTIGHNYPIPTGADPLHCLLPRVRAGENNLWLAFANSCDALTGSFGISGIYGPDTFAFPRSEAKVLQAEGMATLTIDTGDSSTPYPTHVVRRKDLVLMRQPHYYTALLATRTE